MKAINNLKISVKLTGGFLLVALLIGVVALVGYTNMKNINDGMTTLYFDRMLPIQQVGAAQVALNTIRGDVYKYILIPELRTQSRQDIDNDVQTIKENFDKYRATSLVTEEKTALAAFDKDFAVYQKAFEKVLADIDAGNQAQAILSIRDGGETSITRSAVAAAMDKIISINSRIAEQINTDGDVTFAASVRILVIVSLAGIFLAMGLGVFLSRSLSNGIKLLVKTAEQISQTDLPSFADAIAAIANGDLTKSVSVQTQNVAYDSKDEMGDLARTFNAMITKLQDVGTNFTRMTTNLQELIGEVSESALTVGSTSNQLATAADQTGNVVNQVATTIQQVALGTAQQTQSTTQVATSVEQLSQAIRGVAKGAQEQNNAVNQTYSLVNQLSNAIKEVTQGALEQASGMSQANGSIEMLATALERVALRSDKVSAEAGGAVAASEEGAQIAGKTMQGMKQVASATEQLAGNVRELGKRSAEIGAIVDVIDDIASQTNLLALNAAIEAARTGEHGKGFAVVADEVRKLAERSTVATKEITAMIKGVQSRADEVVQAMGKAGDDVDKAVQLTDQTEKAFQMILTNAKSSAEKVKEILQAVGEMRDSNEQMKVVVAKGVVIAEQNKNSAEMMADLNAKVVGSLDSVTAVVEENTAATEEMSASAESVTRAIENVASVSEENSASVEEVSASSEEMSAQVEELSASAQSLNEIAQTLQQLVAQFKLDDRAVSHANVPSSSAIQTVRTSDIRGGNGGNGGNGHQKTNHRMPVLAGSGQNS